MTPPKQAALLRDAYVALGAAIAALRSMPIRRYADVEEDLAVTAATRGIAEATSLLARHALTQGEPAITVPVDPTALGGARAIGRPVVWEWIATLAAVRTKVANKMEKAGLSVPDDLPDPSPLERFGTSDGARIGSAVLFAVVIVALLIALGVSLFVSES